MEWRLRHEPASGGFLGIFGRNA